MLEPDLTYQLLRNLTSPVVAITSVRGGKENGMISDAAVRASIVPTVPRLSVYIHKFNYSHDMIYETGRFAMRSEERRVGKEWRDRLATLHEEKKRDA